MSFVFLRYAFNIQDSMIVTRKYCFTGAVYAYILHYRIHEHEQLSVSLADVWWANTYPVLLWEEVGSQIQAAWFIPYLWQRQAYQFQH